MVIDAYLSAQHRDNPGKGCASSALLPELGREPPETRQLYTEHVLPWCVNWPTNSVPTWRIERAGPFPSSPP
jgi:hypothetical protein